MVKGKENIFFDFDELVKRIVVVVAVIVHVIVVVVVGVVINLDVHRP